MIAQTICPCFDKIDLISITAKVALGIYDTYDLASFNCIYDQESSDRHSNKLFVKDDRAIAGELYHAIGYDAVKALDGYDSYCSQHDAMFIIDENEAQVCLDLLADSCQRLKEETCPCFNLYNLHEAASSSDKVSCALGASGGYVTSLYDGVDLAYGLEMDVQQAICIQQGNIVVGINPSQYGHCMKLLSKTCKEKQLPTGPAPEKKVEVEEPSKPPETEVEIIDYTCPCFDETDLARLTTQVASGGYDTYDLASSNCIDVQESSDRHSNKLFVKDDRAIAGEPYHAIGYGVVKALDGNTSYCTNFDMRFLIDENEAQICLDLIASSCEKLKEETCPCFNLYDLHESASSSDKVSCALESTGSEITAIYDGVEVTYGLEMDAQQMMSCTQQGNKAVGINKSQYDHCTKLLDKTCEGKQLPTGPAVEYTCPCFDETDLARLTTQVASGGYDTYDLASSNCIYDQESSDRHSNKLFVKDDRAIAGEPYHAIGYGVVKALDGYNSYCSRYDAMFTINKNEAQICLDLLADSCHKLKEETCPCFNLYNLHEAASSNDEVSCVQESTGNNITALHDGVEVTYGLEMDAEQIMSCTQQGNIVVGINPSQYGHCTKLLEKTCEAKKLPTGPAPEEKVEEEVKARLESRGEQLSLYFTFTVSIVVTLLTYFL